MKKIDWGTIVLFLFVLAIMALTVAVPYFIIESDMPDWLKYLLLK